MLSEIGKKLLLLLLVAFAVPRSLAHAAPIFELSEAWEMQWGEVPSGNWIPTQVPGVLKGRNGSLHATYRTTLPHHAGLRDPALFVPTVYEGYELWVNGRQVFAQHPLSPQDKRFDAYQPALIPLPSDAMGGEMLLRVFSQHDSIGIMRTISLGERADLITHLLRREKGPMTAAAIMTLAGIVACCLALARTAHRHLFLAFGVPSLTAGVYLVANNPVRIILDSDPAFWSALDQTTLFLLLPAFIHMVRSTLGNGRWKHLLHIERACTAFFLFAMVTYFLELRHPLALHLVFHALALVSLAATIAAAIAQALRKNIRARFMLLGFALMAFLFVLEVFRSYALLPIEEPLTHWGLLTFFAAQASNIASHIIEIERTNKAFAASIARTSDSLRRLISATHRMAEAPDVGESIEKMIVSCIEEIAHKGEVRVQLQLSPEVREVTQTGGAFLAEQKSPGAEGGWRIRPVQSGSEENMPQNSHEPTTLSSGSVVVPIEKGTQRFGTLVFHEARREPLSPEEFAFLDTVARFEALLIEDFLIFARLMKQERENSRTRLAQLGNTALRLGDRLNNPLAVLEFVAEELEDLRDASAETATRDSLNENLRHLHSAIGKIKEEVQMFARFKSFATSASPEELFEAVRSAQTEPPPS